MYSRCCSPVEVTAPVRTGSADSGTRPSTRGRHRILTTDLHQTCTSPHQAHTRPQTPGLCGVQQCHYETFRGRPGPQPPRRRRQVFVSHRHTDHASHVFAVGRKKRRMVSATSHAPARLGTAPLRSPRDMGPRAYPAALRATHQAGSSCELVTGVGGTGPGGRAEEGAFCCPA